MVFANIFGVFFFLFIAQSDQLEGNRRLQQRGGVCHDSANAAANHHGRFDLLRLRAVLRRRQRDAETGRHAVHDAGRAVCREGFDVRRGVGRVSQQTRASGHAVRPRPQRPVQGHAVRRARRLRWRRVHFPLQLQESVRQTKNVSLVNTNSVLSNVIIFKKKKIHFVWKLISFTTTTTTNSDLTNQASNDCWTGERVAAYAEKRGDDWARFEEAETCAVFCSCECDDDAIAGPDAATSLCVSTIASLITVATALTLI